jgi:hypothetical protein
MRLCCRLSEVKCTVTVMAAHTCVHRPIRSSRRSRRRDSFKIDRHAALPRFFEAGHFKTGLDLLAVDLVLSRIAESRDDDGRQPLKWMAFGPSPQTATPCCRPGYPPNLSTGRVGDRQIADGVVEVARRADFEANRRASMRSARVKRSRSTCPVQIGWQASLWRTLTKPIY